MRLFLFITLLTSHLFAITHSAVHSTISSINDEKESITISTPDQAQVGMYGLIMHSFDETHSIALSWVEVQSITGETSTLSMTPIHSLEQSALPSGTWTPQLGDEVILGYNYHRALLISQNLSAYKKVTAFHKERTWIHPDIFTTVLSSHGHPTPLKEDFQYACRVNNIGLVSFSFDNSIITVDCQSFKILENRSTTIKIEEIQLPFYSRISNIEENWFGEGSSELEEYSPYYIQLLAENNPENKWIQDYKKEKEKEKSLEEESSTSWFDSVEIGREDNEDSSVDIQK